MRSCRDDEVGGAGGRGRRLWCVLTYEPGIEIEVQFTTTDPHAPAGFDRGPTKITWIGYVGRAGAKDALPAVGQHVLEAHRLEGAALDEPSRTILEAELAAVRPAKLFSWLKVCIDAAGVVTGVHPRLTSSLIAQDTFIAAVKKWSFRPVVLGTQPTPVCALVHVDFPATSTPTQILPLPLPDDQVASIMVAPGVLAVRRIAGERAIMREIAAAEWVRRQPLDSRTFDGVLLYCIDATGRVDAAVIVRPTRIPHHDQHLVRLMATWRFRPLEFGGRAARACTHLQLGSRR